VQKQPDYQNRGNSADQKYLKVKHRIQVSYNSRITAHN